VSNAAGSRRKGRRGGGDEEHENGERWLVSYSDMITVLMALFIVLFAISSVNEGKFKELSASLSEGFNGGNPSVLDGSTGNQPAADAPDPTVTPSAEPTIGAEEPARRRHDSNRSANRSRRH
jgi:flagellar motor protein MotB